MSPYIGEQGNKTVKISGRAWALLRRAKYQLNAKSYSEAIMRMAEMMGNKIKSEIQKEREYFTPHRHVIRQKRPDNVKNLILKPKTIVLTSEAHQLLQQIKVESDIPEFTLSDAIEFLVTKTLEITL